MIWIRMLQHTERLVHFPPRLYQFVESLISDLSLMQSFGVATVCVQSVD